MTPMNPLETPNDTLGSPWRFLNVPLLMLLFFFFLLSLLTMLWLSLLLLMLLLVVLLVLLLVLLPGSLIDPSLKSSSYMISNLVSSSQSHKETAVWGLSLVSFWSTIWFGRQMVI